MKAGQATVKKPRTAAAPSKAQGSRTVQKSTAQKRTVQKVTAQDSTAQEKRSMATKTKAKEQTEAATAEKEAPETPDTPLPLLDLSDAAVKKMIKQAKKRGYVTHDELNAVLPSEEVSSDQIEDIYAMLNEMGINVIEAEDNVDDDDKSEDDDEEESEGGDLVETKARAVTVREGKEPSADRTDDPVRMYLREMGSVELLSREGRSPSPSASRPAARP